MGKLAIETAVTSIVMAVLEKLTIPIEQIAKAANLTAMSSPNTQPATLHTYAGATARTMAGG